MEEGQIEVDSIEPIGFLDITPDLDDWQPSDIGGHWAVAARPGPKGYDREMPSSEVAARIQATDSTANTRCHCGTKAKWTASLRLKGAQIDPAFQHGDLCDQHAEQFAAIHHLRFPPTGAPSAPESKP